METTMEATVREVGQLLIEAVESGDQDAVRRLLAEGASPNASDLLDTAVENNHSDIAHMLIEAGASLESCRKMAWYCPFCLEAVNPLEEEECEHVIHVSGAMEGVEEDWLSRVILVKEASCLSTEAMAYVEKHAPAEVKALLEQAANDGEFWLERPEIRRVSMNYDGMTSGTFAFAFAPDGLAELERQSDRALDWLAEHEDVLEEGGDGNNSDS